MSKPSRAAGCLVVLALICLAAALPAAAGSQKAVLIQNLFPVDMVVSYKCYTKTSWEQNNCPTTGQHAITINANSAYTKTYNYLPGMGCQNIYVRVTRYDRSTDLCTRTIKIQFPEDQSKLIRINKTGQKDCDYELEIFRDPADRNCPTDCMRYSFYCG